MLNTIFWIAFPFASFIASLALLRFEASFPNSIEDDAENAFPKKKKPCKELPSPARSASSNSLSGSPEDIIILSQIAAEGNPLYKVSVDGKRVIAYNGIKPAPERRPTLGQRSRLYSPYISRSRSARAYHRYLQ